MTFFAAKIKIFFVAHVSTRRTFLLFLKKILKQIKKLIEEKGCSDKVSVDNEYKLVIEVAFAGTVFEIMFAFTETGELVIFLCQKDHFIRSGRSKNIIRKLAKTLDIKYQRLEYTLQIVFKEDVDVAEEIKKIILKMI